MDVEGVDEADVKDESDSNHSEHNEDNGQFVTPVVEVVRALDLTDFFAYGFVSFQHVLQPDLVSGYAEALYDNAAIDNKEKDSQAPSVQVVQLVRLIRAVVELDVEEDSHKE